MSLRAKQVKGLYAIIDTSYAPLEGLEKTASLIIEGGAKILQLRSKGTASGQVLEACRKLRRITLDNGAIFIVNDRVDIAIACGADGVHLGQEDIPLTDARSLLGASAIIGVSTHNTKEAKEAEASGADYISFGPVFPTKTKADAQSPKGLEGLKEIRKSVRLPIVAIGGVTEERLMDVLNSGADGAAIISDILASGDIRLKVSSIVSKIGSL
ncbi:MAG: thiamine phosphate synthase [Deltaproteobacteria bacterium]|nr:thiamine phosphate synthase [Deltaproteobacteria bacterium]